MDPFTLLTAYFYHFTPNYTVCRRKESARVKSRLDPSTAFAGDLSSPDRFQFEFPAVTLAISLMHWTPPRSLNYTPLKCPLKRGRSRLTPLRVSDLSYLSCFLVLPVSSGLKWPIEFYSTFHRTIVYATSTIPAFIRMKNNGRHTVFGMRDIHVDLACLDAIVTSGAIIRVKNDWLVWCDNIRHRH
jgi:hypothetical protein